MLLASCVIKKEQDAAPAFLHIRSYEKYKVKLSLNWARGWLANDPSANLPWVFVSKSSFILWIPGDANPTLESTLYGAANNSKSLKWLVQQGIWKFPTLWKVSLKKTLCTKTFSQVKTNEPLFDLKTQKHKLMKNVCITYYKMCLQF